MFLPALVLFGPPLLNRLLAPTPRALPQRSTVGETTGTTTQNVSTGAAVAGIGAGAWVGVATVIVLGFFFFGINARDWNRMAGGTR